MTEYKKRAHFNRVHVTTKMEEKTLNEKQMSWQCNRHEYILYPCEEQGCGFLGSKIAISLHLRLTSNVRDIKNCVNFFVSCKHLFYYFEIQQR